MTPSAISYHVSLFLFAIILMGQTQAQLSLLSVDFAKYPNGTVFTYDQNVFNGIEFISNNPKIGREKMLFIRFPLKIRCGDNPYSCGKLILNRDTLYVQFKRRYIVKPTVSRPSESEWITPPISIHSPCDFWLVVRPAYPTAFVEQVPCEIRTPSNYTTSGEYLCTSEKNWLASHPEPIESYPTTRSSSFSKHEHVSVFLILLIFGLFFVLYSH